MRYKKSLILLLFISAIFLLLFVNFTSRGISVTDLFTKYTDKPDDTASVPIEDDTNETTSSDGFKFPAKLMGYGFIGRIEDISLSDSRIKVLVTDTKFPAIMNKSIWLKIMCDPISSYLVKQDSAQNGGFDMIRESAYGDVIQTTCADSSCNTTSGKCTLVKQETLKK